jgi:antibiotic biosynthesis monooxygenase (ABM) superfamily enzyme
VYFRALGQWTAGDLPLDLIARYATTSLIETWIDEAERRAWFLFEATR